MVLGWRAHSLVRRSTRHTVASIAGFGSNVSADGPSYLASLGASGIIGTPGITLGWGLGYQTYIGWDGRGKLAQTDFTRSANADLELSLTPIPGYGVLVSSFDLDEWAGGGTCDLTWTLSDPIGTLATGNWVRSTGGRDLITTGLTAANLHDGQTVTFRLQRNSGSGSYMALDNLVFDQIGIPEPSALSIGLMGLGALALRRRRG